MYLRTDMAYHFSSFPKCHSPYFVETFNDGPSLESEENDARLIHQSMQHMCRPRISQAYTFFGKERDINDRKIDASQFAKRPQARISHDRINK
jgi:hypothetical protein